MEKGVRKLPWKRMMRKKRVVVCWSGGDEIYRFVCCFVCLIDYEEALTDTDL